MPPKPPLPVQTRIKTRQLVLRVAIGSVMSPFLQRGLPLPARVVCPRTWCAPTATPGCCA